MHSIACRDCSWDPLLKHVGSLTPMLVQAAGGPEIKPRGTVTETLGVVVISSATMKHGAGRY